MINFSNTKALSSASVLATHSAWIFQVSQVLFNPDNGSCTLAKTEIEALYKEMPEILSEIKEAIAKFEKQIPQNLSELCPLRVTNSQ